MSLSIHGWLIWGRYIGTVAPRTASASMSVWMYSNEQVCVFFYGIKKIAPRSIKLYKKNERGNRQTTGDEQELIPPFTC